MTSVLLTLNSPGVPNVARPSPFWRSRLWAPSVIHFRIRPDQSARRRSTQLPITRPLRDGDYISDGADAPSAAQVSLGALGEYLQIPRNPDMADRPPHLTGAMKIPWPPGSISLTVSSVLYPFSRNVGAIRPMPRFQIRRCARPLGGYCASFFPNFPPSRLKAASPSLKNNPPPIDPVDQR